MEEIKSRGRGILKKKTTSKGMSVSNHEGGGAEDDVEEMVNLENFRGGFVKGPGQGGSGKEIWARTMGTRTQITSPPWRRTETHRLKRFLKFLVRREGAELATNISQKDG
ncbi:hypothetical protein L6452_06323 [Arctium lappa]|uniref:Uncharacterized protein n=1 Tax=Arctium lappa TaxID=4217 RepID=A0ACB9EJ78_ARCLA|nr:hypothetical protein L6452_06323 [Arctium lappa]